MLNARVPAAGEAMPAVTISPTIASVIVAHKAAMSVRVTANRTHESPPKGLSDAARTAIFKAADTSSEAERAVWAVFLDAPCLSPIDVQAKLAHVVGDDGSFDEEEEYARLLRSLVLPAATPRQDAGANYLADALNSHPAHGPSLAEQMQAHRGRSVFHDADGHALDPAPKPTFADLESEMCDLPLSAAVAHQLICGKLFNPINGQDYVSIGRYEREVIEHALFAVENRANELREKYLAILEVANAEAGQ